MRILFIAPRFHSNQIHLISELLRRGHIVDFFVVGKGISESYNEIVPNEIPLSKLNRIVNRKIKDFSDFAIRAIPHPIQFYKMINDFQPDVIVLRGASSPLYSRFVILYSIFNKLKIVFYTQGPKFVTKINLGRKVHDWFFVNILKYRWFTPVLHKGIKSRSQIEIPYIEFIPFFMPQQIKNVFNKRTDLHLIRFLCVGKFEIRKNIRLLLEVIRDLNQLYSNFELTIIGSTGTQERDNYYDLLKNFVNENCLSNVKILKNVPFGDMKYHYEKTDVMIQPSIKEPASISQIEAMSFGCAVICSLDNGTAHYVENDCNGIVCEVDYNNLYNAIKFYLDNPNKTIEHGEYSLELIRNKFSIDSSYEKLIKVLKL